MCNIVPAGFVALYNPESEIELMSAYAIAPLSAFPESLVLRPEDLERPLHNNSHQFLLCSILALQAQQKIGLDNDTF